MTPYEKHQQRERRKKLIAAGTGVAVGSGAGYTANKIFNAVNELGAAENATGRYKGKFQPVRFKALKSFGLALPVAAAGYFGTKAVLNTLD
jgi:hypothetical protein